MKSGVSLIVTASVGIALLLATWAPSRGADSTASPNDPGAGMKAPPPKAVNGWLAWRGPHQNGTTDEKGLPDTLNISEGGNLLWSYPLHGRSSPVIANGRVYAWGYEGEGPELQEVLVCLDAEKGTKLWEKKYTDFLSDVVYNRYSIGAPTVDPETGCVYICTTPGEFECLTADGKLVWHHSLMEEIGKLTFPNSRTGAPSIEGDLVVIHGVNSNWGAEGPGRDRFYAYDKKTGGMVWSSTPGLQPKDNSFATPVYENWLGKRVFYSGTGDGNIVCVDANTGQPLWRYEVSHGGLNASVVVANHDTIIAVHADENPDSSVIGRMIAIKVPAAAPPPATQPGETPALTGNPELWRNPLRSVSSSPVLVGDRLYLTDYLGELQVVDVKTGKVLGHQKLGTDQLHASPLYGDGKLYVPIQTDASDLKKGLLYIIKPTDAGGEVLSRVSLDGNCLGSPAVFNGKVYLFTTEKIYCFGKAGDNPQGVPQWAFEMVGFTSGHTQSFRWKVQFVPVDVLLRPGQKATFTERRVLDGADRALAMPMGTIDEHVSWKHFIPPTARVRSEMDADFNSKGELVAKPDAKISAGAFEGTDGDMKGYIRGRVLPELPYKEDFEKFEITVPHETEAGVKFAYPPLPWIGARFKWEVREKDGGKVLTKTIDNIFFQRAFTFIGTPDMKDYTVAADVMTDGNRRTMMDVGVINQRYLIALIGNAKTLEVTSNQDRLKATVPFAIEPGKWYRLTSQVEVKPDGSGVVRAKAWPRGEAEPASWTIETPVLHVHENGSPGLYGFAHGGGYRVYIDNVSVAPNK